MGVTTDITLRKQAEEALQQSRNDLARAQEVANVGSWRLNLQTNDLDWSEQLYRIFGISPGTPLTYETFLSRVHPEDRPYVNEQWRAALRGDKYDLEHRVIVHGQTRWVREMFKAGACGYLLKDCPFDELVEAIRIVVRGKTYISPSIGDTIIKDYLTKPGQESAFSILSAREREVLQLLAEGHTTKQAGQRLGISPKTVEVHRTNIMEKLNIDNIAQLTKYAIQEGLTSPEP